MYVTDVNCVRHLQRKVNVIEASNGFYFKKRPSMWDRWSNSYDEQLLNGLFFTCAPVSPFKTSPPVEIMISFVTVLEIV